MTLARLVPVLALLAALATSGEAKALNSPSLFDQPHKLSKYTPDLVQDLSLGGQTIDLGGGDGATVGNPVLSLILSAFIPGLGQALINGQVIKGIIIFAVTAVLLTGAGFMAIIPLLGAIVAPALGLLAFLWWVGNLIDAYTGNFYAFLPNSVAPIQGGGGDVARFGRDGRLDLVIPETRPAL